MEETFETTIFYYYQPKGREPLVRFHPVGTPERSMSYPVNKLPSELQVNSQGTPVKITINDNQVTRVEKIIVPVAHPQGAPAEQPGVALAKQPPIAPAEQPQIAPVTDGNRPILPYTFVPFDQQSVIDDFPVWHDGSIKNRPETGEQGIFFSGELSCTLTAKTPLLPGNYRYTVKGEKPPRADPNLLEKYALPNLDDEKQIAEPLRLPDGRVVIPGSALKGMLRHSLGALLSAPMERVGERHFTYRPNLDFNGVGTSLKYTFRPALTKKMNENNDWVIEILDPDPKKILFVRNEAKGIIDKNNYDGKIQGNISNIDREIIYKKDERGKFLHDKDNKKRIHRETNHLVKLPNSSIKLNHRIAIYKGGIDGEGIIAGTFKPPTKTYKLALVPLNSHSETVITSDLYNKYKKYQELLADDTIGHLKAHPTIGEKKDRVKQAIIKNYELVPNQLIYVELTTIDGQVTNESQVVSFGHHIRYRWAYTSSIRKKDGKSRACLIPTQKEWPAADINSETDFAPEQLTGARLLFGYVRDKKYNEIGKGKYERLAGRIAINHAVSVGVPNFLGKKEEGYCVPLPILGQPKPSAWEFYLEQGSSGPPSTYGDLPAIGVLPGDPGGDLAGRKFYRHQPGVTEANLKSTDLDTVQSDQATLARFICDVGRKFMFTVRFSRLRSWELCALLATLQPHHLAPIENGTAPSPGDYGHKLGLGRPLGMGSVVINVDKMICNGTEQAAGQFWDEHNIAFLKKVPSNGCRKRILDTWLGVHRIQPGVSCAYPTKANHKREVSIFEWHTDLRRTYSKLRRQASPDWNSFRNKIKPWLAR